jgi:hypothetical protein
VIEHSGITCVGFTYVFFKQLLLTIWKFCIDGFFQQTR